MVALARNYRLWIIGAVVAIFAIIDGIQPVFASDFQFFSVAGRRLLSGEGLGVYDFEGLQIGPLHLLFNGVINLVAGLFVVDMQVILSLVCQVGFVIGLILVARRIVALAGGRESALAEVGVAALAIAFTVPWTIYLLGHPAEAIIPLLWILAAREAMHSRFGRAGVLIAVAVGFEPWGVVGLPLLFLGTGRRSAWLGTGIAAMATALLYSPFFLFGDARTFEHVWPTVSRSVLVGLIAEPGEPFTWAMRLAQFAAVTALGAALVVVAHRRGTRTEAVWAIPVAMTGLRILIDPSDVFYQWVPFQTAALVGVIALVGTARNLRTYVLIAAVYGLFLRGPTGYLGSWALGLGILVCLWRVGARAEETVADPEPVLPPVAAPV